MDATQGQAADHESEMTAEQLAADAAADAEFEAAFTNARSDELGTEGSTSNSSAAANAAAAEQGSNTSTDPGNLDDATAGTAPEAGTTAPAEDEDAPVTLTRRQLNEMTGMRDTVAALQAELRQTVDSTNGRLGSIQQTLKEVRARASKGIRPSFAQMDAMEEAFPELAAVMKRDLEKAFGEGNATQPGAGDEDDDRQDDGSNASGAQAPGAAPAINPLDAPEVKEALRVAQLSIVDARHAGWRDLPKTPEWTTWQAQLPPAARELLLTTRDAETLTEALDDFKGWRDKQAKVVSASNQRGKRLEHAVPATNGSSGAVRTTMTDDDAFEAGFKEVRSR